MSKVRRVDFSPDEWLVGTRELELDERGAYWDACSLIYSRGGPIADDERWLAKALACDVRTWRRLRARLLEVGKLRVVTIDGQPHLTNERAEREIERANGRIEKASRGGKAKAEKHTAAQHRPDFGATSARSSGDPAEKSGPELSENNGLGSANYQPSTINDQRSRESLTVDRGRANARAPNGKPEKRRSKLPPDWTLTPELREWTADTLAGTHATARVDIDRELEKFKAHHIAKGNLMADWNRAWHTWTFNAIE